jgi:orotidine-5'-phosphate decarboxylase
LSFSSLLSARWKESNSLLCVGLDPDPHRLTHHYSPDADGIEYFCIDIIDATAEYACAEAQLERICAYIRSNYPTIPIILDAKRGDIGDTATMYAREAFDRYGAHAVTVNPYMGGDTIEPYLVHPKGAAIVLCRTSNAGSGEFQSQLVDGKPLYQLVAERAANEWSHKGEVALVVGATYPAELAEVRAIVGDMALLVPGVGAQGGNPEEVVKNGANSLGTGLIVNSSRAILYADKVDPMPAAARVARETRDALNAHR